MKLVVNRCYGGFALSKEAVELYIRKKDRKLREMYSWEIERNDSALIEAIEELGLIESSDEVSQLEIVEIPDEATDYYINEYDGLESIIYVVDGKIHFA